MKTNLELLSQLTKSTEWAERIAAEVEAILELEPQTTPEDAACFAQAELLYDLVDAARGKARHIRIGLSNSLAEKARA